MDDRRHDDERLNNIAETVAGMKILLEQVHFSWFGKNGNDGYKTKIDKMEAKVGIWSKIASSGLIAGISAFIKGFF